MQYETVTRSFSFSVFLKIIMKTSRNSAFEKSNFNIIILIFVKLKEKRVLHRQDILGQRMDFSKYLSQVIIIILFYLRSHFWQLLQKIIICEINHILKIIINITRISLEKEVRLLCSSTYNFWHSKIDFNIPLVSDPRLKTKIWKNQKKKIVT